GTIHIITNNQIGFTTNPLDARSTRYCTEVAKMVQAPILHVNGDDPEAAIFATRLAIAYRMRFHKDVVIDLVCYRRHGHNEADDPTVTQPYMYGLIQKHPTTREIYAEKLIAEGVVPEEETQRMIGDYRMQLDTGQVVAGQIVDPEKRRKMVDWSPYMNREWDEPAETAVSRERLEALSEKLITLPETFEPHPRVAKLLQDRRQMALGEIPMDWGCAETLAYATLLEKGHPVRLSGQDVGRGTFSHRHATLHDRNRTTYIPLQSIPEHPSDFLVIDSLLSEAAVLGFEYGYAATDPKTLVIWEAQFGDFANGAQVIVDQFLSAGEAKWERLSGITLLLPHGQEGQGPEHSSARLERFLQLCAEHNMQVCVPTTPAQMFHLLRRQVIRMMRRPLIVMSPKSLLRHRLSVSSVEDLANGEFQPVIPETDSLDDKVVKRVVFCCGKVYFDLLEERRAREQQEVAIVRVEQLHPFPKHLLQVQFERYSHVEDIVWCQEEPKNQGAWYQINHHMQYFMLPNQKLSYVGRLASPSPAVGFYQLYVERQKAVVDEALSLNP
ncbi:MAG: 2-oxoglutarate dehydrogenase E1 component, partial [Pseudomonadota bacterium]|nr:2-oxoglutarate dehydrogenase E1 component [Pseudomonadota bacterium]